MNRDDVQALPFYEKAHIGVGDGWLPILAWLDDAVRDVDASIKAVRVKEKLGGLQVFCDEFNSKIDELIAVAARTAAHTCEACGSPGYSGGQSWIKTLCATHHKERER